jgi:hypothetical protein
MDSMRFTNLDFEAREANNPSFKDQFMIFILMLR